MLTTTGSKARQRRMLAIMEERRWDLFLTANYRTAYYFTGLLGPAEVPVVFALYADGRSFTISPAAAVNGSPTELIALETYSIDRSLVDPMGDLARLFSEALAARPGAAVGRIGVERASAAGIVEGALTTRFAGPKIEDALASLLRLRKRKEQDEIEEIRTSLSYCATAYRSARYMMTPGNTELDVYLAMYADIVKEAGTSIPFPGDFACGHRSIRGGGAPTTRALEARDLFPLDLFPAPALYFGDTCRTFVVGGRPDDAQMRAWETVCAAVEMGERAVRPGVRARDVYRQVKDFLDAQPVTQRSFWHHLGHGIGFHGHEAPRIIPGSDDVFEVGDVFTLEPGCYVESLGGGIRLEDNYVVTETGIENLFNFPRDL
jgi:Xaa-Pro dipeptidase